MNRFSSGKRLVERLTLPLTAICTSPDNLQGKVIVKNISLTGTCLLTQQNLSSGAELKLAIMMPARNRETIIYGEVIWQNKCADGYLTGVKFTQSDPSDIERIVDELTKK